MAIKRGASAITALAATAALLAACSSGGASGESSTTSGSDDTAASSAPAASSAASDSAEPVTLTWWHNGTNDPLKGYWEKVAADYMAMNPNVTIEISAIQNEELQKTKIPAALQGDNPPSLYQQWGGGELADQVAAGKVMDISDLVGDSLALQGGSVAGWQVDGKTYGLPFSMGVEGFWYNKADFAKAGITTPPATMTEFMDAIQKLKDAGITPIAVGAKDKWPAAHYWYNFALRDCPTAVMQQAGIDKVFTDPCFVKAGEDLQAFLDSEPFNKGFLGTPAQQGATSSAGLVANGKAAMELMGHWDPAVMADLTEDGKGLGENLGWFAFPAIEGGQGDPGAALGGGDGFSCSAQAPPECADFLNYIASVAVQTGFAETGAGLPVSAGAEVGVTDPNMVSLLDFRNNASYVQLWLDVAYGGNIGGALNDAVANMFAGQGSATDIVTAMNDAAASQ